MTTKTLNLPWAMAVGDDPKYGMTVKDARGDFPVTVKNGPFIVNACNNHDALVDALQDVLALAATHSKIGDPIIEKALLILGDATRRD